MKTIRYSVLSFICVMFFIAPAFAEVSIGQKAPDFRLRSIRGENVSLSDYAGKTVVLEWTNHQCPYVEKHYGSGNMQRLQKDATDSGVVWLSIVSSAPGRQGYMEAEEAQVLVEKLGANATHRLMDPSGEVGKSYGAKTTPHMYVINAGRKLVYMGAIDDRPSTSPKTLDGAHNYVRAALQALETGMPIKTSVTRSYGCAVKYAF